MNKICLISAKSQLNLIKSRKISSEELLKIHFENIDRVNKKVNAIVTFSKEEALRKAREFDNKDIKEKEKMILGGLPIAHKDAFLTKNLKTTFGSKIYENFVPCEDSIIVERFKNNGAITFGKTNVPELTAGSQTYNEVFGATLNPYDITKTCGGSSGGSAVALACGMMPIGDGSDLGGSLRNPASFCNVVGFRPSVGAIPNGPGLSSWFPLAVVGPMARNVEDVTLLMQALSGLDCRDPKSIDLKFNQNLRLDPKKIKIAWSPFLGDLPVETEISNIISKNVKVFEELGFNVEEADPDLKDADEIFKTLRAWYYCLAYKKLKKQYSSYLKESIKWNIAEGEKLQNQDLIDAELKRTVLFSRMSNFMKKYDFIIAPVTQVLPFSVQEEYVKNINNVKMESYIDWMKSCYYITVTGLPALSVPCGFSTNGLPVGIQIIGGFQKDLDVLSLGRIFEKAINLNIPPKLVR